MHVFISFPLYAFAVLSLDNHNHITLAHLPSGPPFQRLGFQVLMATTPTFLSHLTSGPSLQRPGFMVCQQSLQVAMLIKEKSLSLAEKDPFPLSVQCIEHHLFAF